MNITQCKKKEKKKIEFQLYTKLEYKPEIRICRAKKKRTNERIIKNGRSFVCRIILVGGHKV